MPRQSAEGKGSASAGRLDVIDDALAECVDAVSDKRLVADHAKGVHPIGRKGDRNTGFEDDDTGAGLPIRTGIQTSLPGYQTRLHSHPYAEVLTVLAGRGEAWLAGEEGVVALEPGVSITFPAGRVHAFRVVGEEPLVTYGIHTFGKRIDNYEEPPAGAV